jgi:prevent-host-death family protein
MTSTISATKANQEFSSLLRKVQEGEDFVVMSRGRPVARVVPYNGAPKARDVAGLIERLKKLPRKTLPDWKREDLYD